MQDTLLIRRFILPHIYIPLPGRMTGLFFCLNASTNVYANTGNISQVAASTSGWLKPRDLGYLEWDGSICACGILA